MNKHILIKGKVQNVFYRMWARKLALDLGLAGWIKNLPNGHVECFISGKKDAVESFIYSCQKGSLLAKVEEVEVLEEQDETNNKYKDFNIIY